MKLAVTGMLLLVTGCGGVVEMAAKPALDNMMRATLKQQDVALVRDGAPAYLSLGSDERWRLGLGVDEVDPRYLEALLRYEDKRFHHHPGVDPLERAGRVGQADHLRAQGFEAAALAREVDP